MTLHVMAGLVPATHVFFCCQKVVDGRDKHGHDDLWLRIFLIRTPVFAQPESHGSSLAMGACGRLKRAFMAAHWPRPAALAKRRASSAARNSALALSTHSCCSRAGSESATIPAPAWTYMVPSLIRAVRRTMQVSISPAAEK